MRRLWRKGEAQPLVLIVALGFALRLAIVVFLDARPVSDFLFYFLRAAELANTHTYSMAGHPTAFWPIGYPSFLAALFAVTGPSLVAAKLANVALWVLTLLGVYWLARPAGIAVARGAALAVAIYPDFVLLPALTASENLFIPLLVASLLLLRQCEAGCWYRTASSGFLLGLATLVRSTSVLLIPLLAVAAALRGRGSRERFLSFALFILSAGLAMSPWLVRNWMVFDTPVLTTNGGQGLWYGNNEYATGTNSLADGKRIAGDLSTLQGELAQNAALTREAFGFIVGHPGRWLQLVPRKAEGMFRQQDVLSFCLVDDSDGVLGGVPQARQLSERETLLAGPLTRLYAVGTAWQAAYWLLGLVGTVALAKKYRSQFGDVALVVAYWLLFHLTLSYGHPRYLLSVAPLLAPGVAASVLAAVSSARRLLVNRIVQ